MSTFIWYSGATDVTGVALAEALRVESGKSRPRGKDIIIGWGTKTDEAVDLGNAKVLNHPNAIRKNRNKLSVLQALQADRNTTSTIAKFCPSNSVMRAIERGDISYPLIARKKYHQGGKGLWTCLVKSHVEAAITAGADYFQNYIDIGSEYRLHVLDGKIIYAVKKVENPTEAGWTNQRKELIKDHAAKHNTNLNDATIDYVLGRLVKEAVLPDRIVRSNRRGWKFSGIAVNTLPAALKNAAIKAVEIIGLDFGAVDCALDVTNHPFIIEVNTGPGLQGTSLEKYTTAFREKIAQLERPVERPIARARQAVGRAVAGARRAVGADHADDNGGNVVNDGALVHMMNAVNSPEEARRVLDLMGRG